MPQHLMIYFPRGSGVNKRAKKFSTGEGASKARSAEQANEIEKAVLANGRASSPVLTSGFSIVMDHSEIIDKDKEIGKNRKGEGTLLALSL